jgi:hypothetical protein
MTSRGVVTGLVLGSVLLRLGEDVGNGEEQRRHQNPAEDPEQEERQPEHDRLEPVHERQTCDEGDHRDRCRDERTKRMSSRHDPDGTSSRWWSGAVWAPGFDQPMNGKRSRLADKQEA